MSTLSWSFKPGKVSPVGGSTNVNVVPPWNEYDSPGFWRTPLTKISKTASRSIKADCEFVLSFSKLSNWPLKNRGNLVLEPSCKFLILSIKSSSPNCQEENLSLKTCNTSNSISFNGFVKCAAVTSPTGLNLSPILNEWPGLAISNSDISNVVEPIPTVVLAAPTLRSKRRLDPVSVVAPTPNLDTPITGTSLYVGSGIMISGFT